MKKHTRSSVVSKQVDSEYFQKKIYDGENATKVVDEFFLQVGFVDAGGIIDFLKAMYRVGIDKFYKPTHIESLESRINALDASSLLSSKEIAQILNCLADIGYKKHDLKILDIRKLANVFNHKENYNPKQDTEFLRGFARLGCDKDEIELNTEKLTAFSNVQFANFSTSQKIAFLYSMSQFGYDFRNDQTLPVISRMIEDVSKNIDGLEGFEIASFLHACAKMEMFENIFENNPDLPRVINSILTPQKIAKLSSKSAFSLMQAQMLCQVYRGKMILSDNVSSLVCDKYVPVKNTVSKIQKKIADTLKKMNAEVGMEESLFEINGKSVRDVDIVCTVRNGSEIKRFFIEIDGPQHFLNLDSRAYNPNSLTRKRDDLNVRLISEKKDDLPNYYLKISSREIDLNRGDLENFLQQKLQDAKELPKNEVIELDEINLEEPFKEMDKKIEVANINLKIIPSAPDNIAVAQEKSQNKKDKTRWETVLESRDLATIKKMIETGGDVNAHIIDNGLTPLEFIFERGKKYAFLDDLKIIKTLVDAGANLKSLDNPKNFGDLGNMLTVSMADPELESLTRALIKLDSIQSISDDFLHSAVLSRSLGIIEALVKKKGSLADCQNASEVIKSAYLIEDKTCGIEILNNLVKAQISTSKIEPKICQSIFNEAMFRGYPDLALTLLKQNEDRIDVRLLREGSRGFSMLYLAAQNGFEEMIPYLISRGIDINDPAGGETPLIGAIRNRQANAAKLLIELNADINIRPDRLRSPNAISMAINRNNLEIVNILLEKGANPECLVIADGLDINILGMAVNVEEGVDPEIMTAILKKNQNADILPRSKQSLFLLAIKNGYYPYVRAYIDSGRNYSDPIESGKDVNRVSIKPVDQLIGSGENMSYEILEAMIDGGGVNSETTVTHGEISLLFYAIYKDNFKLVKFLLDKGMDCINPQRVHKNSDIQVTPEEFASDINKSNKDTIIGYIKQKAIEVQKTPSGILAGGAVEKTLKTLTSKNRAGNEVGQFLKG